MIHPSVSAALLRRLRLALVPVLLIGTGASAQIQIPTQINADLLPPAPAISGQSYDPTSQPEGPAGVFSFVATVCNNNGDAALDGGLQSRTASLSGGNAVVNRDADPAGVGSEVWFPATGQYSDRTLGLGQCVAVPYQVGLQQRAPFTFTVDFEQVPVAICSQCDGLDCLLSPVVGPCANDQDVCTTFVDERGTGTGGRVINRDCGVRATALANASSNPTDCENIEGTVPTGTTCWFVCDGVTDPDCNTPPELIPRNGRLTP